MRKAKVLLAALSLAILPATAQATVIDFEAFTNGPQGIATLVFPEATFTSSTGNVYINGAGASKDFCAYDGSCAGITTVDFTTPVNNLTLNSAGDDGSGLLGNAAVYVNGVFAGNVGITYDGNFTSYDPVDLTAFSNITRVVLTSTDGAGVTWDNFSFDAAAIPEPATLLLLGLGLAAVARRRTA